jgi:hypothetical protein
MGHLPNMTSPLLSDTVRGLPSLLGMAPTITRERIIIESRRAVQHAFQEFEQGVTAMMEEGSTEGYAAITASLVRALNKQSESAAALQPRPTKPHWPTLIGSWIALAALIIPALLYCGALQNRVATLEGRASAFDRIASLDSKMESLTVTVRSLEDRFNSWMDKAAENRK